MKVLLPFALCALFAAPVFAADEAGTVARSAFAKHWQSLRELTVAVASAMPAEDYDFKPNPEEMTFGEQMAHIAMANGNYFSQIAGKKSPLMKPDKADKETVAKLLNESFDYCANILNGLRDADLDHTAGPMTVRERILGAFVHTAHHRGQAEVYLRVKNIKPPQYKF